MDSTSCSPANPTTLATFTRTIVSRLAQRIRSRSLITQLRANPLVTVEDCADVARTENLVLRNLKITQMYHRLSLEMTTLIGHQDANWCTFACNASKTAGYSIRKENPELIRSWRVSSSIPRACEGAVRATGGTCTTGCASF